MGETLPIPEIVVRPLPLLACTVRVAAQALT